MTVRTAVWRSRRFPSRYDLSMPLVDHLPPPAGRPSGLSKDRRDPWVRGPTSTKCPGRGRKTLRLNDPRRSRGSARPPTYDLAIPALVAGAFRWHTSMSVARKRHGKSEVDPMNSEPPRCLTRDNTASSPPLSAGPTTVNSIIQTSRNHREGTK